MERERTALAACCWVASRWKGPNGLGGSIGLSDASGPNRGVSHGGAEHGSSTSVLSRKGKTKPDSVNSAFLQHFGGFLFFFFFFFLFYFPFFGTFVIVDKTPKGNQEAEALQC